MDENTSESTKFDMIIAMLTEFKEDMASMNRRLEILEQGVTEKLQVSEDSGDLFTMSTVKLTMVKFTDRLEALERKSLRMEDENGGLKASMKSAIEVCTKNTNSLRNGVCDLRRQMSDLGRETARLTKSTIARESLERNNEAKNVAVYNITEELIKPHRKHTNSEEEAVGSCVRQLAKRTIENLCDKDIKSIRKISSNSPKGCQSAIITFVSVGDAQKFEFRLNQAMMGTGPTTRQSNGNRRMKNKRKMNARTGLTVLQRSLLSDAETMVGTDDTHPRDMRLRRENIRKLTDWRRLETPVEFKVIYSQTEEITKEPISRN
jgi:hypothetical protein